MTWQEACEVSSVGKAIRLVYNGLIRWYMWETGFGECEHFWRSNTSLAQIGGDGR